MNSTDISEAWKRDFSESKTRVPATTPRKPQFECLAVGLCFFFKLIVLFVTI